MMSQEQDKDYLDLLAELMGSPQEQVDEARLTLADRIGTPEPDYPDGDEG